MISESDFQKEVIENIRKNFPDAIIMKNDPGYLQGIPDLTVLCGNKWAMLEIKRSATSPIRPNQRWYIEKAEFMSFGSFIYPENKEKILKELYVFLKMNGGTYE